MDPLNPSAGSSSLLSTPLSATGPLGNLAALPLELAFDILDECLVESPRLTHKGLCALRCLALSSLSGKTLVNNYLQRNVSSRHLRDQLQVEWWPYMSAVVPLSLREIAEIAPIEGLPGVGPDLITDTVMDDCPECFDWLCKQIPKLDAGACNEHGWAFIAIACHAGSFKILEHFLDVEYPLKAPIGLLAQAANHNTLRPTPIGLMAQKKDLQFFEHLFEVVEPHLHALRVPSVIRGALTWEDKLDLCTFATPELAERLEEVGVNLFDISGPSSSSWHAGALNGPAFLEYLNRKSTYISKNGPMWVTDTPLHTAVKANKLDSVRWLKQHGANPKLTYRGDSRRNPIHLAATLDSEMSVEMLEELIPAPGRGIKMTSSESGKLLYSLVEGLALTTHRQAVRTDLDEAAYREIRDLYEDRAIRKCRLILRVSADDHLAPVADSTRPRVFESGRHFAIRQHEKAKELAYFTGFERLLHTMDHTPVYVRSPFTSSVAFQIC